MSGTSSVGQSSVYEAGDQRNAPASELNTADRYNEGKENSHKANDSSTCLYPSSLIPTHTEMPLIQWDAIEDERSIANRLANAEVSCLVF